MDGVRRGLIVYQGRAGRYSSEPPPAFPWTEAFIIVASRADGGLSTTCNTSQHRQQAVFAKFPYTSSYYPVDSGI